jgi:hypothetical protein
MIIKVVTIASIFLINSFAYCMDSELCRDPHIKHIKRLQLDLCMLISRDDLSDKQLCLEATSLLQQGADPHYANPLTGRNYLMLSVQSNNLAWVKFFIGKNLDCNLSDANGCNARSYNIMHKERYLEKISPVFIRYATYQKQVATNRAVFPEDTEAYEEDKIFMFDKAECRFFFEALRIDRILEKKEVSNPYTNPYKIPLYRLLARANSSLVKRAIKYAFTQLCGDWKKESSFPSDIYDLLYVKLSRRHSL